MINLERKSDIQKDDKAYQVMGKYFWAKNDWEAWEKWLVIQKNNKDRLAKMAWVQKYDGGINHGEQNTTIANRLRKNDVVPFYDSAKNEKQIKNFDEVQNILKNKNLWDQRTMEFYIKNLNDDQIKMLNKLSPLQKALFIAEECKKVDITQLQINKKVTGNNNLENKNLAVMKELTVFNENMSLFLKETTLTKEYAFDNTKNSFNNVEVQIRFEKNLKYVGEIKKGTLTKVEKEYYVNLFIQKDIIESWKYDELSEENKKKFNELVIESYTIAQKLDIDLESFDLGILYARAREYLSLQYSDYEKEPAHTLMNTINADPQVTSFFAKEQNKISSLVPNEVKSEKTENKIYYTKLFAQYPDINIMPGGAKTVEEYLAYFNDDMTIKADLSASEKEEAEKALVYIQERTTSREGLLLDKTNKIVQDHAMNQCIESLQQYMDIDIDEKQNLLDQLKVMEGTDVTAPAEGELMLKINGERAGKKITLSYDLKTWQVYYHPFLYKASVNETDPLVMGNQTNNSKVPLTTLASMKTIITGAKKANYKKLFVQSDDMKIYTENIKENMDKQVIFWEDSSSDMGTDMLKKQVIQDDIVQNIMSCTGKIWWVNQDITKESPNIYWLYNYIYKSLAYYSMKSVDQLILFNKNIQGLLTYRSKKSPIDEVMKYKEDKQNPTWNQNQEMFALQSLVHPSNIPEVTNTLTDQWPEEKLKLFFDCFNKEIWGINIIDAAMMDDYFTAATWTNKENNEVGKRKRNDAFTTLTNNLETKISGDQATADLDTQLKNLPENEKSV